MPIAHVLLVDDEVPFVETMTKRLAKVKESAAKKRGHEEKIIAARLKEITSRRP